MYKRKPIDACIIILNILALACLVYAAALYLSRSAHIANPDAMLPMQDWERGGSMLLMGLLPMLCANGLLCWLLHRERKAAWLQVLCFLPFLTEAALAAHNLITGLL